MPKFLVFLRLYLQFFFRNGGFFRSARLVVNENPAALQRSNKIPGALFCPEQSCEVSRIEFLLNFIRVTDFSFLIGTTCTAFAGDVY